MTQYWHQPNIDPVLFKIWGPLQVRWYSVLYVGGILLARAILKKLSKEERFVFTSEDVEEFLMWLLAGVVVGSRVFYCLFYDFPTFISDPLFLFRVYEGGLSFHGGLVGVLLAAYFFSRKRNIPHWNLMDGLALATPSGLALGRIGNFINGELYGRVSTVPWAMIFKSGGVEPRHPSQVYEFFLEGAFLFALLWLTKNKLKRNGQIALLFGVSYSLVRFVVEFFREPDAQLGFLFLGLSMGQLLSLATIALVIGIGVVLYHRDWKFEAVTTSKKTKKKGPKK